MGQVSVSISGELKSLINPIGCMVTYPRNGIPTALVEVEPATSKILENFESHRHTFADIVITGPSGRITFNGFLDGMSFNQTPGGFSYQAVFKSKFQDLNYVYPRMLGVSVGASPFTRRPFNFLAAPGTPGETPVLEKMMLGEAEQKVAINSALNLVDAYLKLISEVVKSWTSVNLAAQDVVSEQLVALLNGEIYQKNLDRALNLLTNTDTSGVKDMIVTGQSWPAIWSTFLDESLFANAETLWDLMVEGLRRFGCGYIMSNNKIFITPENTFLRTNVGATPGFREESSVINAIYPAQYTSVMFNDNGFKDLRYCVLMAGVGELGSTNFPPPEIDVAVYEDTNTKSTGLAIEPANYLINALTTELIAEQTPDSHGSLKAKNGNVMVTPPKEDDAQQVKTTEDSLKKTNTSYQDTKQKYAKMLQQFAKIKYLQRKFSDRTGTIQMPLNFNWCPGTSGMLVSRYPGIAIDFYVDAVTHRVTQTAPNSGEGSTSISFSSGRLSQAGTNDPTVGLTGDEFYKYDVAKMQAIQAQFIQDLAG